MNHELKKLHTSHDSQILFKIKVVKFMRWTESNQLHKQVIALLMLALLTFFLQFFPEIIKEGHLHILDTPLFRVRDKKETIYCYSEFEKQEAIKKLRGKPEITRFKGLGEISPNEFSHFIGDDIRLDPVMLDKETSIEKLLSFYMGKNTPQRQKFIINNLKVELDLVEKEEKEKEIMAKNDLLTTNI